MGETQAHEKHETETVSELAPSPKLTCGGLAPGERKAVLNNTDLL